MHIPTAPAWASFVLASASISAALAVPVAGQPTALLKDKDSHVAEATKTVGAIPGFMLINNTRPSEKDKRQLTAVYPLHVPVQKLSETIAEGEAQDSDYWMQKVLSLKKHMHHKSYADDDLPSKRKDTSAHFVPHGPEIKAGDFKRDLEHTPATSTSQAEGNPEETQIGHSGSLSMRKRDVENAQNTEKTENSENAENAENAEGWWPWGHHSTTTTRYRSTSVMPTHTPKHKTMNPSLAAQPYVKPTPKPWDLPNGKYDLKSITWEKRDVKASENIENADAAELAQAAQLADIAAKADAAQQAHVAEKEAAAAYLNAAENVDSWWWPFGKKDKESDSGNADDESQSADQEEENPTPSPTKKEKHKDAGSKTEVSHPSHTPPTFFERIDRLKKHFGVFWFKYIEYWNEYQCVEAGMDCGGMAPPGFPRPDVPVPDWLSHPQWIDHPELKPADWPEYHPLWTPADEWAKGMKEAKTKEERKKVDDAYWAKAYHFRALRDILHERETAEWKEKNRQELLVEKDQQKAKLEKEIQQLENGPALESWDMSKEDQETAYIEKKRKAEDAERADLKKFNDDPVKYRKERAEKQKQWKEEEKEKKLHENEELTRKMKQAEIDLANREKIDAAKEKAKAEAMEKIEKDAAKAQADIEAQSKRERAKADAAHAKEEAKRKAAEEKERAAEEKERAAEEKAKAAEQQNKEAATRKTKRHHQRKTLGQTMDDLHARKMAKHNASLAKVAAAQKKKEDDKKAGPHIFWKLLGERAVNGGNSTSFGNSTISMRVARRVERNNLS